MDTRTHVFLGVSTTAVFVHFALGYEITEWEPYVACCSMAALGSILPDTDHPTAWMSKNLPPVSKLVRKWLSSSGKYFGDENYQSLLNSHRGICHSFSACLFALISPVFLLLMFTDDTRLAVCSMGWGLLLHILADMLTPMGCMLFAPFSTKLYSFSSNHIKTNTASLFYQNPYWYLLLYLYNILIYLGLLPVFVCILAIIDILAGSYSPNSMTDMIGLSIFFVFFLIHIIFRLLRSFLVKKIKAAYPVKHYSYDTITEEPDYDISNSHDVFETEYDNIIPFDVNVHKRNS